VGFPQTDLAELSVPVDGKGSIFKPSGLHAYFDREGYVVPHSTAVVQIWYFTFLHRRSFALSSLHPFTTN
jgi:hypothetical protein